MSKEKYDRMTVLRSSARVGVQDAALIAALLDVRTVQRDVVILAAVE